MTLSFLPHREPKPRKTGLTMCMDKGLTQSQAEGICIMAGEYIDFIKLGFGTSIFTLDLAEKLKIYRKHGIEVYPGGTLFEAFYIRGMVEEFEGFVQQNGFTTVEISDGSVVMDHTEKCQLIERFSKKYRVLSEVGSKVAGVEISDSEWVDMMHKELEAGSSYVIAEAREAGNIGIFDAKGGANKDLVNSIARNVGAENIIWETPTKAQQVWFVKEFGAGVNVGNIAADEILSLETIRNGLRGDTFGLHLPDSLKQKVQQNTTL